MNTIDEALADIRAGKCVIVVDDEDRENEGDLICAAELCTEEIINFMATEGRGLICVSITEERAQQLELPLMVNDNTALHGTRFTVSVDYVHGTASGISTYDRNATVQAMVADDTKPADLGRPGHTFPLIAMEGGVLRRAGHTEAVVDLAKLAGLKPCGVLCEVLKADGTMARMPDLVVFAQQHGLKIISVQDLIAYRRRKEQIVRLVAEAKLPSEYGDFTLRVYENTIDGEEHVAIVKGAIDSESPVLVRVHSECLTGDLLGSRRCDCGPQLHAALRKIEEEGSGVVLYMRQEGRGIGLVNKIKAYALQEQGLDTVEANLQLGFQPDPRDYGIGAQILFDLGVRKMRLMTNNPKKRVGLQSYGLEVVELIPLEIPATTENQQYLQTKRDKMGHILRHL
ncbi:MAG: bifunctional 3,4-dihydroxy-2-butanone-4-phosphate synthase/GTP cyclohydrolase II ['Candidatus Kapabacteria' thiocyanatum]|uniref:Riboflavin biosynthesis protein RibBA n=1 Tax=Candidatus Kapaibacterium thiocyanatum TaxID=1895771 RepID=A0A1M3L2D2_9BACT|nr:bifunctional 3,4-dihydroxy-2-butanone-4-phosphate synthase/GTP cyclohydrolase II ['Candidatus Kapabacteria' thiocyanatum]OJX59384.1 MAG: bifunctional 3,4-dihydroxy-2-butanone 4-phosphate synthase/GTP cyclohydrolase II ['Candidatus Kapabacteria' thiocyanatum]